MRVPLMGILLALCTLVAEADEGERLFNRECVACHMAEARGAPQVAPELREHVACLAQRPGGRAYLAGVLKHGLEGSISVEGKLFDGYMPAPTRLSTGEKAAVLNYLVSLSARCPGTEPFTVDDVETALSEGQWNSQTLRTLREQLMQEPPASGADISRVSPGPVTSTMQAAEDFARYCQGCHTSGGQAIPGQVPALRDNIGLLVQTPAGRAFLVRVPGVAFAPLGDQRVAALLNWMLGSLSVAQRPASFTPYRAAEVATYRRQALVDVEAAREQVVAQLLREGFRFPQ